MCAYMHMGICKDVQADARADMPMNFTMPQSDKFWKALLEIVLTQTSTSMPNGTADWTWRSGIAALQKKSHLCRRASCSGPRPVMCEHMYMGMCA